MKPIVKILLIDDNPEEFVLLKEAVGRVRKDIECCYAGGVVDAFGLLESIKGNLPDLIFLDVNMPMHNGRDCLKSLKQSKRFSHIPVIMYTIQDLQPEAKADLRTLGATFFLQKPQLNELILILRFLLSGRQTTEELKDVAKFFVKLA